MGLEDVGSKKRGIRVICEVLKEGEPGFGGIWGFGVVKLTY